MTIEFTTVENVLNLLTDDGVTPLTEVEDGIASTNTNLYSLVMESGVLDASDRIPPKPTSPLGKLWVGKCTIYEYEDVIDADTYQTVQTLKPVLVNEPCRLSYNHEQSTNIQSGAAVVSQSITLFIRPDLVIRPGSVIEITQHNVTEKYKGSGHPAIYSNHQEIILQLYEEHA